ncbi:MAG: TspO/MBR family protein [Bosea sp. (in: a-proteobacteria)]|uniref:TspO/MBR family protein n=1 Tax=Bosea sp. (in: a-proteobacteria) TaxID=1871050 RepID=UPI0027344144|nr:TspO/MBR family protein [Bosea sp. (in: a-proteobacteria)]MDP3254969.1 TspO/MBR family protein [Bosea sp. (in: a-proteobacteria)]MDP3318889.1 TspO/MBR family protein [Bosea sp. (in: a-proteobacteria)]
MGAGRLHVTIMSTPPSLAPARPRPFWIDALIAIGPVVAVSLLGNAVTIPQVTTWYPTIAKPPFNPPNWVFGPVWTTLFALMAYGVYRILRTPPGTPGKPQALIAYHVQLALNLAWSCVFFGLNSPLGGLLVILPFLAMILVTIALFGRVDRLAANLQWPYVAWVSFATLLNVSIWWLNR